MRRYCHPAEPGAGGSAPVLRAVSRRGDVRTPTHAGNRLCSAGRRPGARVPEPARQHAVAGGRHAGYAQRPGLFSARQPHHRADVGAVLSRCTGCLSRRGHDRRGARPLAGAYPSRSAGGLGAPNHALSVPSSQQLADRTQCSGDSEMGSTPIADPDCSVADVCLMGSSDRETVAPDATKRDPPPSLGGRSAPVVQGWIANSISWARAARISGG